MDFVYVYVKLTDKANKGSALYWCDRKDPEDWLAKDLRMSKNSLGEWETSLQNIGEAGFDLVSVTPYQKNTRNGEFRSTTEIENLYIFKRRDELETTDLSD